MAIRQYSRRRNTILFGAVAGERVIASHQLPLWAAHQPEPGYRQAWLASDRLPEQPAHANRIGHVGASRCRLSGEPPSRVFGQQQSLSSIVILHPAEIGGRE